MREQTKLATIECSVCAAWIDIIQQYEPELALFWEARGVEGHSCQHPPSASCPQARAEVARRYPDGGAA